ncbi:MAG: RDD family protein [Pseudomonadota bacterium]
MTYMTATSALPDPIDQPEFYVGVLPKRAMAWVIDVFLITALTFVAGILTLSLAWFLWPLFFLVIGVLYRVSTLTNRSATWGMRAMGIELRDVRGERFDGLQATLHVLGYYGTLAFVLPALASFAAMVITDKRQSLTDLLLGTAAINRPG